jgi:hypothetical protein
VLDRCAIFDGATGLFYNATQFNKRYEQYFFKHNNNDKLKPVKRAWTAFTQCEFYSVPKVYGTYFRPELESLKAYERYNGRYYFNTYIDIPIPFRSGDPSLFLEFIRRLYPNPRGRKILLTYMASILQCPGKKARWAPILQGVRGNGKTIIVDILRHALDKRYFCSRNISDIKNKFGSLVQNKLFVAINGERISKRAQFLEYLKYFITSRRTVFQKYEVNRVNVDNRANFLIIVNHKSVMRELENYGCFTMLPAAQQKVKDLRVAGLTLDFFHIFLEWLYRKEGFEIINNYLLEYDLEASEFNFDICVTAPTASITHRTIKPSKYCIKNIIQKAVAYKLEGFRGDWIVSHRLKNYVKQEISDVDELKKNTHHRQLNTALRELGYIFHPGLKDGRTSFALDGIKPRLYIKKDSPLCDLRSIKIRDKYLEDQEISTDE